MRIDHMALYTFQLEAMRAFYIKYFGATSNEKYLNPRKGFASYFLSFGQEGTPGGGARLEIMQKEQVPAHGLGAGAEYIGLTHLALAVGTRPEVDALTERLRADGYPVVGEPRTTGDGYYESVVLDPDGNRLELVAE
ncbi:VOC family protein [Rhabdobacter roseus]|uniref:Lactoylglutathione lyase n=1 Tax=Rhabdobacter roseus TaxID=1655419 RepID=A0A840TV70_9BACT|nr:VOC family protein [Rhabdobacter roseus]MBB5283988.1 lactoylglutathione lyase [Rhabdobacter roseus]